ncbi:MAG: cyclic peptide export ABC transporter [Terriglobia bacterium]
MKLFLSLLRSSPYVVVSMGILGLLTGLFSVGLIVMINFVLHADSQPMILAFGFAALILGKLATNAISQVLLVRLSQNIILDLCKDLCQKVTAAPFRRIEELGPARILAVLTDDIASLGLAIQNIPFVVVNGAILTGCSFYLAWLSSKLFLVLLGIVLIGMATYKLLLSRAQFANRQIRDGRDRLFQQFRSLTEGIKELLMHRARRESFHSQNIGSTIQFLRHHSLAAASQYILLDSFTQVMFFGMIGGLLFFGPRIQSIPKESLTGYCLATLYMMGPIWAFIGIIPTFQRGQVSLFKVEDLRQRLQDQGTLPDCTEENLRVKEWKALELKDIVFTYESQNGREDHFILGPLNFTLHPGELVFIVGGNGSGKSTFAKLLVGLYSPQQGEIFLDGELVSNPNRVGYREQFSVVFSDFYLFDSLLGLDSEDIDAKARECLSMLHLSQKVDVQNGIFSTTLLSQGQRKRLALLTAYLEDRPVYLFDEWAADQDPQYKEIFYCRILPSLRARGKAVIVITHDDRYFHLGDRVIKLEYGKIVSE